jgi:hypothetical protein
MFSSAPLPALDPPGRETSDLVMPGSHEAIMVEGDEYFNSTNDIIRVDILRRLLEITNDSRQTPANQGGFGESALSQR